MYHYDEGDKDASILLVYGRRIVERVIFRLRLVDQEETEFIDENRRTNFLIQ